MAAGVGSIISFHDIRYEVAVKAGCCGAENKLVLNGVSGAFMPGTMNAIMGPTGCGKSSLLDILAGRKDPKGLSGLVLVDGCKQPENFKLLAGYVQQDDVIMGTLTVKENLMFSANLRLPSSLSTKERKARVQGIIKDLGLEKCADTKVGNEFIRGVSGGERKRTSIGAELVTYPGVLFLDEPTTGLDASTAHSVMSLLKRLSRSGSTIVFSIHQPRYSICKLFDKLTLLANGEMVFYGPALEALEFFNMLDYRIEPYENPSDFYLDIINGDCQPTATGTPAPGSPAPDTEDYHKAEQGLSPKVAPATVADKNDAGATKARIAKLSLFFRQSDWFRRLQGELNPIQESFKEKVKDDRGSAIAEAERFKRLKYQTSFITQFAVLCRRTFLNLIRNPRTSFVQLGTVVLFALIAGTIFYGLSMDCASAIQNRVGALFFIIMNTNFSNMSAVDLFIHERLLFIHENAGGYYRVSSYFLAKVICDVIPNRALPVLAYSAIAYWMIGFDRDVNKFLLFTLTLMLISLSSSGLAFAISSGVSKQAIASLLIALCYVFMMIFSGLLVNIESLASWLKWFQWLSLFRYALKALQINELKDKQFYVTTTNGTQEFHGVCSGNTYLDQQGTSYSTPWDFWYNNVALGVASLLLGALTYVQLRRARKFK